MLSPDYSLAINSILDAAAPPDVRVRTWRRRAASSGIMRLPPGYNKQLHGFAPPPPS